MKEISQELAHEMWRALCEIKRCNARYNFGGKLLRTIKPAMAMAKAEGLNEVEEQGFCLHRQKEPHPSGKAESQ
jgi:hypothetical protein